MVNAIRVLVAVALVVVVAGTVRTYQSEGWRSLPFVRTGVHIASYIQKGEALDISPGLAFAMGEQAPSTISAAIVAVATGEVVAVLSLIGSVFSMLKRGYKERATEPDKAAADDDDDDDDDDNDDDGNGDGDKANGDNKDAGAGDKPSGNDKADNAATADDDKKEDNDEEQKQPEKDQEQADDGDKAKETEMSSVA